MFTKLQAIEGLRLLLVSELELDNATFIKEEGNTILYTTIKGSEVTTIEAVESISNNTNEVVGYHVGYDYCSIGDVMIAYFEVNDDEEEDEY